MQTQHFAVVGMDCAHCARTLEQGIGNLHGVESCQVNLGAARLTTCYDPALLNDAAIIARIRALGYHVAAAADERSATQATPPGKGRPAPGPPLPTSSLFCLNGDSAG
ncbi:MAG: heavy-metal-associated domain-containing protein [Chloroflexaceae bacterium]|nr:heavy-metal-associated domain-containing protein [Chloroflexaceae bacterium]